MSMTNKEYREHEGISKSSLFKISKSPLHFKYAMDHPEENDTEALLFGRAVHKWILEPDTFYEEFAIMPTVDRRTNAGKEAYAKFLTLSEDKDVITEDMFSKIKEMADVVNSNEAAKKLICGEHEHSFFWTDEQTGEPCKCRPDILAEIGGRHIIVDYKTTDSAETSDFMKSAIKYGYDLQAGMYTEGMKANTGNDYMFVFIAQEKKPPYAINIVEATEDFISEGNQLFHDLLGIYHECKVTDNWYGYMQNGKTNVLDLPDWLKREVENGN